MHIRKAKFKGKENLTQPSANGDNKQRQFSYSAGGNTKWHDHFGKHFGSGGKDMEF